MSPLSAVLLVLWVLASPLSAQPDEPPGDRFPWTFELDAGASRVQFTLGAFLHKVEGSFRVTRGEIRFDPETGRASGRVVVDATSGDTGNEKRDRDMHSKVLESEHYPEIVLEVREVRDDAGASESGQEAQGKQEDALPGGVPGQLILEGTLSLHGGEHEVSIPVRISPAEASGAEEALQLKATGTFRVPYVEWGLEDPSTFFLRVEKHVDVSVHAEGLLRRSSPPEEPSGQASAAEGSAEEGEPGSEGPEAGSSAPSDAEGDAEGGGRPGR